MSVDLEKAITLDSSVVKEDGTPSYIDGETLDVNANAATKAAIIAANTIPKNVNPETGEVKDEEPVKPLPPKKTVREMAAEKYGSKSKQTTIATEEEENDNDS